MWGELRRPTQATHDGTPQMLGWEETCIYIHLYALHIPAIVHIYAQHHRIDLPYRTAECLRGYAVWPMRLCICFCMELAEFYVALFFVVRISAKFIRHISIWPLTEEEGWRICLDDDALAQL